MRAFSATARCASGNCSGRRKSALLRAGIEQNLAHLSPRAKVASGADDPGRFVEDFCNWQDNEYYRRFVFDSALAEVAGRLMRSSSARLYHDHMLTKEPRTRQPTPWHQDQPYYNIDGRQNCSFWIPVDAVSRESTLEFVAGSHLGPWLMPRSFMDAQAKWFPEGSLADLPNIEAAGDAYPILGWDLEPGDVVCFHMLTLHAAPGVTAGRIGAACSRYDFSAMTSRTRRVAGALRRNFPACATQLPAGAADERSALPGAVAWSRARSPSPSLRYPAPS